MILLAGGGPKFKSVAKCGHGWWLIELAQSVEADGTICKPAQCFDSTDYVIHLVEWHVLVSVLFSPVVLSGGRPSDNLVARFRHGQWLIELTQSRVAGAHARLNDGWQDLIVLDNWWNGPMSGNHVFACRALSSVCAHILSEGLQAKNIVIDCVPFHQLRNAIITVVMAPECEFDAAECYGNYHMREICVLNASCTTIHICTTYM